MEAMRLELFTRSERLAELQAKLQAQEEKFDIQLRTQKRDLEDKLLEQARSFASL